MGDNDNFCRNFLKKFDIYAQPIQLQFRLSTTFKSALGGLVSLILYILFIAIFVYLYSDMHAKTNYIITTNSNKYEDPPKFNITADETKLNYKKEQNAGFFFYGFAIVNKLTGVQYTKKDVDRIFYIEILNTLRNKSSGAFTNLAQYEIVACSDVYPNINEQFESPLIKNALCVNESSITLNGDFISNYYQFISMKFKDCSASVLTPKPVCASTTENQNAKKEWHIVFLYTDYQINNSPKRNSPVSYLLSTMIFDITSKLYQKYDLYLGKHRLETFENLYDPTYYDVTQQPIVSLNKVVKHESNPSRNMLSIYLRSDYDYKVYSRKYKIILDFLSQIGGIWKVIFMIGAFLMVPVNMKLLKVAISNDIFNIVSPDKKDIENQTYENYIKQSAASNRDKILAIYNKSELECKMALNYYKYERNKGMNYTIKEAFSSSFLEFCKPKSIIEKEKIFKVSEERLMKRLDLSSILNFAKQVNFMKRALLGRKALLVSFSHKYAITYNKLKLLKQIYKKFVELKEMDASDMALLKEKNFITGLRSLKNKIGVFEKTELNLIYLFKFDPQHLAIYFRNHIDALEKKYKGISKFLNPK